MLFAQRQRLKILKTIISIIAAAKDKNSSVDKEKLIYHIQNQYGSTRRKVFEYIEDLKRGGEIEEDSEGLWIGKKYINDPEGSNQTYEASST